MSGGRHDGDRKRGRDRDDVTVVHSDAFETHRVGHVDVVRGARRVGQRAAAGDVVVVNVRLEHMSDPHPFTLGEIDDAVDVTLRVDDESDLTVVGQVGTIAECLRVDGDDRGHGVLLVRTGLEIYPRGYLSPPYSHTPWGIK